MKFRDVRSSVRRRLQRLAKGLKQKRAERKPTRNALTKEILAITQRMILQAKEVTGAGKPSLGSLRRRGKRLVGELETWLDLTEEVIQQTTRSWREIPTCLIDW